MLHLGGLARQDVLTDLSESQTANLADLSESQAATPPPDFTNYNSLLRLGELARQDVLTHLSHSGWDPPE